MVKKIVRTLLPLLLAGLLIWWVLKDMPWAQVRGIIAEANWWLVAASLLPTLFSHLMRAQRWRLLLEPVATIPTLAESFAAVMAGYVANLAAPRAGELVRCTLLARKRGTAVDVSLGTVIAERAFDVLMLGAVTALAFLLNAQPLIEFFGRLLGGKTSDATQEKGAGGFLLIAVIVVVGLFVIAWLLRDRLQKLSLVQKVWVLLGGLFAGVFSALRLKSKGQFLLLTVGIWVCYYYSAWICLEAVPGLENFGPMASLMIFTVGSFGMVAPVPGGVGPFEFMVIAGLTQLYQAPEAQAAAAALLMHNSQMAFALAMGGPCLAWLLIGKNRTAAAVVG